MTVLNPFAQWVQATALSLWINQSTWIWPLCETLHFIGLSLLIGGTGFFDLRLIGFFKRIPIAAAKDLMPLALIGFAINAATGVVFLIGLPGQYMAAALRQQHRLHQILDEQDVADLEPVAVQGERLCRRR